MQRLSDSRWLFQSFEAAWFHSKMNSTNPWNQVLDTGISSEYTISGNGPMDFFAMSPRWGIELVRDSDRLVQHLDRFKRNGAYYTDIISGIMKDWIILDFRHSFPKKTCNTPSFSKEHGEWPGLIFWNRSKRATAVEGRFRPRLFSSPDSRLWKQKDHTWNCLGESVMNDGMRPQHIIMPSSHNETNME